MKSLILALMFAVVAIFALPHATFAADGKVLYETSAPKCVMCHGGDGHGKASMKGSDLTLAAVRAKSDAALAKVITEGAKPMKAYTFSADELKALVVYVRTLQK